MLDIACGDNRIAANLPDSIGVDIIDYGKGGLIIDRFDNLPFQNEKFACVTIIASLNYFDKPQLILKECTRLLKTDGKLLLTQLNPKIGKLWHTLREPWAKTSSFSINEILNLTHDLPLQLYKKKSFMFGLNQLYIFNRTHEI